MKRQSNIPTDEEFARASQIMREKARNLDEVREAVRRRFSVRCPLHDFYILDQRDVDFRAYVFFNQVEDVELCLKSGVQEELIEFVYSELERVGRGTRNQITVAFEFDSHENVMKNFESDYYLRLH